MWSLFDDGDDDDGATRGVVLSVILAGDLGIIQNTREKTHFTKDIKPSLHCYSSSFSGAQSSLTR